MPPASLADRRVLITGAARGIGAALPERLHSRGARVAPLDVAIDALERGIERRARRVAAPRSSAPLLPLRMAVQPFVDRLVQRDLERALEIARREDAPLTTPQP